MLKRGANLSMSLPILCYHKVGPLSEEGRWLNIEPELLRQHIRFFKRRRFAFLQACELDAPWPRRAICLTFDDAYRSTMTYGIEIMRSEGVSGSIYVVSERIGETSVWDGERASPLADQELIVQASTLGFEIGNHTATHPRLSQLEPKSQREELLQCHKTLTDLNIEPVSIAFPYGAHNAETLRLMNELNYKVGLALSRRPAHATDSRQALPRIVLSYGDRLPMLIYKLSLRPRLPSRKRRSEYVT